MAFLGGRGGTWPSTRWSPMWISPDVGRSSPAIMRSRVVFPEPEEPSSTRNSPSRIERSTPSTAWRSPKFFLRLRISMPATVAALPPGLAPVGRRIRRLGQVHRWGVDDVIRAWGHQHWLDDLGRRSGGCRRAPPGATAAGHEREEEGTETRDRYARTDVHGLSLASDWCWTCVCWFARRRA